MQPFSASSPGEVLALTRPAQPTQPDHNGDTQGSAATSQALAPASSSIVIGDNNALNGANCAFQNTVAGDLNLYQVTNIAYPAPDHSARINQLPPQQEDFVAASFDATVPRAQQDAFFAGRAGSLLAATST